MSTPEPPLLLEGHGPFLEHAVRIARESRMELVLLTQALEIRTWGAAPFTDALRAFVLQHERTRVRILVADARQAIAGNSRVVELGRKLSSFVEFREIPDERRAFVREEYLVGDDRLLLYRESPTQLEGRYYATTPSAARLKRKDFDQLWQESTPAQELRDLKL